MEKPPASPAPEKQPRRHHINPVCYLEPFALPASPNQLYVIDAERGIDYVTNLTKVAVEKDFYRAENASGDPFAAEKALTDCEAAAAPVIGRINESLVLPTGTDLHHLVFFIANLWARARIFRSSIEKFVSDVGKKTVATTLATRERWEATVARMKEAGLTLPATDYEGMKVFVESEEYTISVDRGWLVGRMFASTVSLFDLLVHRRWVLYASAESDPASAFVTCDEPVGLHWLVPMSRMYPPGFGLTKTVVTLPLTRRCYLQGYLPPDLSIESQEALLVSPTHVARCNTRTIEHASDLVMAPNRDFHWLAEDGKMKGAADLVAHIRRRRQQDIASVDRVE